MNSLVPVLVTYNRLEYLKKAIEALRDQACSAIVVVDNCSVDGSREWLLAASEQDERIDLVLPEKNLGGAGGFEIGFRRAMEAHNPDWIVCFDDDSYPQPGAFQAFLDSDLDGVDAAAAAVYFPDGSICEMNRPSRNPFWHLREFLGASLSGREGFHLKDSDYDSKTSVAIDATSFVGFFVRAEMVKKVGLPDGRLFIYGDDVLYTLTISRAGGRMRFLPWVRFTHDCSTFAQSQVTYTPLWKAYYTYRNGIQVYHTAAGMLFWLLFPVKLLQWLVRARHYESPSLYLRVVRAAVVDGLFRRYERSHPEVVSLSEGKEEAG